MNLVAIAVAATASVFFGSYQDAPQPEPIALEIKTTTDAFDTSEVIPIIVSYINTSSSEQTILINLALPMGVEIYWEDPQGTVSRAVRLDGGKRVPGHELTIDAGSSAQGTVFCSNSFIADNRPTTFKKPSLGRWKVWASIKAGGKTIKSNVVHFRMEDAWKGAAAEREVFSGEVWHRFVLGDKRIKDSDIKQLRDGYARVKTARQRDVLGYLIGSHLENREDYSGAIELYGSVLGNLSGNVVASRVHMRLAVCQLGKGQFDAALASLDRVNQQELGGSGKEVERLRKTITEAKKRGTGD